MTKKNKTQPALPARVSAPAPTVAGQLVFVQPAVLKTHPRNMRRVYPQADVRQMADSIRARQGVIQPLQLVPDGAPGMFYVVDGNLRLAAARLLGEDCPPLKAEVIHDHTLADQMLDMIIANTIRFDPDPISEALHYGALRAEGLTMLEICERTGQYYQRVLNRLRLLDLDEPIQDLISRGELPHDLRAVEAFLSVPDVAARIKLAQRLSTAKAKISVIVSACARLKDSLAQAVEVVADLADAAPAQKTKAVAPMLALAQASAQKTEPNSPVTVSALRTAARAMCTTCEIYTGQLAANWAEPAWALITPHAERVCGDCNLRDLNLCAQCPGVEFLRALLKGQPA